MRRQRPQSQRNGRRLFNAALRWDLSARPARVRRLRSCNATATHDEAITIPAAIAPAVRAMLDAEQITITQNLDGT
jgi:hypothetical protein